MPSNTPAPPRIRPLAMIRIAIIVAVVTFGAATWWLHASGRRPSAMAPNVNLVTLVIWALATVSLLFLRRRLTPVRNPRDRNNITILGWAAGETAAFAGIVHYFVTGDPQRFLFGMIVFVVALLAFPLPRD